MIQDHVTKLDFSGQDIYVGIDISKKSWKVTILTKDFEHKTFTQPPKPQALVHHTYIGTSLLHIMYVSMKLGSLVSGSMMLSSRMELIA